VPDVQTLSKPYLSHPDSKLDVLYRNLDLINESYPVLKSKLPFEEFDHGGLTGYAIPVIPAYQDLPILGVNICPLILW
jgi:hypothetical protein